jgi:2-polyprenyl-3-methyl-5-hydroxy-6-metoxy-1,4-benzoquinol methylase
MSTPASNPVDHSLTYRGGLRNLPHRRRLRAILAALARGGSPAVESFADVGCSNGYVTAILRQRLAPARTVGFDHVEEHLSRGRREHPEIEFRTIDLNRPLPDGHETFDLVTCFETLEHVGRLDQAIANLSALTRPGGTLLITTPIESGPRGLLKFLIKVGVFRYSLRELPAQPHRFARYLAALVANRSIASFRDERNGWGTHFGFDWREVERILHARGARFESWSALTTRFVRVQR